MFTRQFKIIILNMLIFSLLSGQLFAEEKEITFIISKEKYSVPIQQSQELSFKIDKAQLKSRKVYLEFDARIDCPGIPGYSYPLILILNNRIIPGKNLVNVPQDIERVNGSVSNIARTNYSNISGINGKVTCYVLSYAENFEIINSNKNAYRFVDFNGYHFVFDITDLLRTDKKNKLKFYNNYTKAVQKIMKAELPMILKNVKIKISSKKEEKPLPHWLKEIALKNNKFPYISPKKEWCEKYSLNVSMSGMIVLKSGKNKYLISSSFSYPGGGYNYFGEKTNEAPEKTWLVNATERKGEYSIVGRGKYYTIKRKIIARQYYVEVYDTIINRNKKDLPVIISHQLETKSNSEIHIGGNKILSKNVSKISPENPTIFIGDNGGGIGLTPVDDVFRVHCANFISNGVAGIKDEKFILPPQKQYSMRWQIFPVAQGNYYSFLNNLRHCWRLNKIKGNAFVGKGAVVHSRFSQKNLDYIKKRPYINYVLPLHISVTRKGNKENPFAWGYAMRYDADMHKDRKKIIMKLKKELPENIKVLACYMAPYFSNDPKHRDRKLFENCMVVNKDGSLPEEAGANFFIPTKTNAFGKMVTEMIDIMLDDWKSDGIYFDYLEGNRPYYTYNTWDGHSADIDPKTKKLITKKGSYQLLSQDYIIWLIKRIIAKKGIVVANRSSYTWTSMQALKKLVPIRLGEVGAPGQLARGQLAPCPASYQRTYNNIHTQILRSLYAGMLTYPYDYDYTSPNNPFAEMWPFSYLEMHKGYVIGKNKIITMRSGYFGWGDNAKIVCFLFNKAGKSIKNDFKTVSKDNCNYMKIKLQTGQIAVLKKKSEKSK